MISTYYQVGDYVRATAANGVIVQVLHGSSRGWCCEFYYLVRINRRAPLEPHDHWFRAKEIVETIKPRKSLR